MSTMSHGSRATTTWGSVATSTGRTLLPTASTTCPAIRGWSRSSSSRLDRRPARRAHLPATCSASCGRWSRLPADALGILRGMMRGAPGPYFRRDQHLLPLAAGLGALFVAATLVWLLSLRLDDTSMVDIFWGRSSFFRRSLCAGHAVPRLHRSRGSAARAGRVGPRLRPTSRAAMPGRPRTIGTRSCAADSARPGAGRACRGSRPAGDPGLDHRGSSLRGDERRPAGLELARRRRPAPVGHRLHVRGGRRRAAQRLHPVPGQPGPHHAVRPVVADPPPELLRRRDPVVGLLARRSGRRLVVRLRPLADDLPHRPRLGMDCSSARSAAPRGLRHCALLARAPTACVPGRAQPDRRDDRVGRAPPLRSGHQRGSRAAPAVARAVAMRNAMHRAGRASTSRIAGSSSIAIDTRRSCSPRSRPRRRRAGPLRAGVVFRRGGRSRHVEPMFSELPSGAPARPTSRSVAGATVCSPTTGVSRTPDSGSA